MNLFNKKYGKKLRYLVIAATNLCLCVGLCGCFTTTINENEPKKSVSQSDIANMGRDELGANVGDNYYAYVNFERLKTDEIPYGEYFLNSNDTWVKDALQKELETIYKNKCNYKQGSNEQKIADCYAQYIDTQARNEAGIAALEKILSEIDSADSIEELLEVSAKMRWDYGCDTIFNFAVSLDLFDSNKWGVQFGQIQTPVPLEDLQTEYGKAENLQTTIENILKKRRAENYEERARKLTDMLISVAECSLTEDELYRSNLYRKISLDGLAGIFKNADVSSYTTRLESCGVKEITVLDYGHMETVGKYLSAENLTSWKDYLTVRLFCFCGEYLPEEYARLLTPIGVNSSPLTQKEAENKILDENEKEMAYIFTEKYADESVIEAAKAFTQDIIHGYEDMIKNVKKVDEKTKKRFLKKLENMKVNINIPSSPYDGGYEWIPAEKGGCLLANILAKRAGEFKRTLENIGKPFDKSGFDWQGMMPQTYGNAEYIMANYVIIPYATLTKPYFDANGNYYENLGKLGATIGHEISHGFDTEGMCHDENGNLGDWLSDEYNLYFEKKKRNITELYNSYKLFGVYPLDGENTLGENMADLAGLQCVLSMAKTVEEKRTVLKSYAESWYGLYYDDIAYLALYNDVHSGDQFRVNVVVSQMEEFYEAYDIEENDEMYTEPQKRERMWE